MWTMLLVGPLLLYTQTHNRMHASSINQAWVLHSQCQAKSSSSWSLFTLFLTLLFHHCVTASSPRLLFILVLVSWFSQCDLCYNNNLLVLLSLLPLSSWPSSTSWLCSKPPLPPLDRPPLLSPVRTHKPFQSLLLFVPVETLFLSFSFTLFYVSSSLNVTLFDMPLVVALHFAVTFIYLFTF